MSSPINSQYSLLISIKIGKMHMIVSMETIFNSKKFLVLKRFIIKRKRKRKGHQTFIIKEIRRIINYSFINHVFNTLFNREWIFNKSFFILFLIIMNLFYKTLFMSFHICIKKQFWIIQIDNLFTSTQ